MGPVRDGRVMDSILHQSSHMTRQKMSRPSSQSSHNESNESTWSSHSSPDESNESTSSSHSSHHESSESTVSSHSSHDESNDSIKSITDYVTFKNEKSCTKFLR